MSLGLSLAVMLSFFAAAPSSAESFSSWAARGARAERESDPREALRSYANALSIWKEDDGGARKAKILCARARLREIDGDDEGALSDMTGCLTLDKKNSKGFHHRGLLYLEAGETASAIGDFYRAIALDIGFAIAYDDRARAYESQGETGFAREDYRHACGLGVKAACVKAKALASKTPPPPPVPRAEAPNVRVPAVPAPLSSVMPAAPKAEAYRPRFVDCRASLGFCVEKGGSFGSCVRRSSGCDAKPVKGCCPSACLKAYQKSINRDRSEAAAFREHFSAAAACAVPPKEDEDN